jgi:hypothetical protein
MLKLKAKQQKVLESVNDPSIHTIVLIGSVGTGKTDIAAHVGISLAYNFPKTYFTVFRQNISTAKRSVIPSYLNMLDMMGLEEKYDYKYNRQDFEIKFLHNKSIIGFVEADITKDRQGRKVKGINATANHIDEGDELAETMFAMATARKGRRNQEGQPSISIITMNPNDTFMKAKFYDPWKAGTLPKGVIVIEFTIEDSWQTKEDIEQMKTNPRPWVERYLNNNWAFQDDDNSLFKYRYFSSAIQSMWDINAVRTIGNDVARSGTDRSVIALWAGNTLIDIFIVKDKTQKITTDEQALTLIKYMTENAVVAENIAIDAVGIGVGVVDHMKSKGIIVKEFVSGATPVKRKLPNGEMEQSKYDNLRSQVIWEFALGLEQGRYKIFEGCPFRNELISEAMAHLHEITGKVLSVESKEKVKERTGSLSPDIFDAVVMGLFPKLKLDPKNDTNRIII